MPVCIHVKKKKNKVRHIVILDNKEKDVLEVKRSERISLELNKKEAIYLEILIFTTFFGFKTCFLLCHFFYHTKYQSSIWISFCIDSPALTYCKGFK